MLTLADVKLERYEARKDVILAEECGHILKVRIA
jgi:hypothetical protein